MKVLRRSLQRDKVASPQRTSFSSNHQQHPQQQQPTQPFASLAAANTTSNGAHNGRPLTGPPAMVIRATENYKANRIVELSFKKGDFFHVVGERQDSDGTWFEASNPATGARGIVPKPYFEIFGKPPPLPNAQSGASSSSSSSFKLRSATLNTHNSSSSSSNHQQQHFNASHSSDGSKGLGKSQPLYGIVQHDFVAERTDELDAKRGEPIIVIAQSNHEWFVAKPIGRLGGPGLIPVSFVEVQDVSTGKPMSPDQVRDLIRCSAVPKVDEWKKQTAAYKGNSIPLGRFDFGSATSTASSSPLMTAGPSGSSHQQMGPPHSAVPLTTPHHHSSSHSRQHSSTGAATVPSSHHHSNPSGTTKNPNYGSWHGADRSDQLQSFGSRGPNNHPTTRASSPTRSSHPPSHQPIRQQPLASGMNTPDLRVYDEEPQSMTDPDGDGYATVDELRERYGIVVHASVESFHYEQAHFWFHLRAHFTRTLDGGGEETTVLVLYRLYEDFWDFQSELLRAFPLEASGRQPGGVRLPIMPGPSEKVDELVCAQRVEELSRYLHELSQLPLYIRKCELVYEFLGPREGDVELEGDPGSLVMGEGGRVRSQIEVEGEVVEYLDRMDRHIQHQRGGDDLDDLNDSMHRMPTFNRAGNSTNNDRKKIMSSSSTQSLEKANSPPNKNHHLSTASSEGPRSMSSSNLAGTNNGSRANYNNRQSGGGHHSQMSIGGTANNNNNSGIGGGFMKIKIYQRKTDDLIAIKVPEDGLIGFEGLIERIEERIGPGVQTIRYKDETGVGYSTGGSLVEFDGSGCRLVGIDNDDDLQRWLSNANRLILYVD